MTDPALLTQPAARGLSLTGRPLPLFTEPVNAPHGPAPLRRAGSVRRTMSIDATWPDGGDAPGHYFGRCRDVFSPDPANPPQVLASAEARVISANREILSIAATPAPARLQELVGVRAGGHLRTALADVIAPDKAAGAPLYLVLDDLAGTTLVSRWAFSHWPGVPEAVLPGPGGVRSMEGVCIGFRPGSTALTADRVPVARSNAARVGPLPHPADPAGWHELPPAGGMHFRRARSIDVWREGDELMVDSFFQDSASTADGDHRLAIHEYRLQARIAADGTLIELDATPGTLPFAACRVAYLNNEVLLGTPVRELRETVLERLKQTGGCTHLNDTLRALAEVPVLASQIRES